MYLNRTPGLPHAHRPRPDGPVAGRAPVVGLPRHVACTFRAGQPSLGSTVAAGGGMPVADRAEAATNTTIAASTAGVTARLGRRARPPTRPAPRARGAGAASAPHRAGPPACVSRTARAGARAAPPRSASSPPRPRSPSPRTSWRPGGTAAAPRAGDRRGRRAIGSLGARPSPTRASVSIAAEKPTACTSARACTASRVPWVSQARFCAVRTFPARGTPVPFRDGGHRPGPGLAVERPASDRRATRQRPTSDRCSVA